MGYWTVNHPAYPCGPLKVWEIIFSFLLLPNSCLKLYLEAAGLFDFLCWWLENIAEALKLNFLTHRQLLNMKLLSFRLKSLRLRLRLQTTPIIDFWSFGRHLLWIYGLIEDELLHAEVNFRYNLFHFLWLQIIVRPCPNSNQLILYLKVKH